MLFAIVVCHELTEPLCGYTELKEYIKTHDTTVSSIAGSIMIVARVVWTSFDTCLTGPVMRLHLIDTQAPETLKEMHEVRRSSGQSWSYVYLIHSIHI
jgi:hypothetical protein